MTEEKDKTNSKTLEEEESIPEPWVKAFSNSQKRKYYYNPITKKSIWNLNEIIKNKQEEEDEKHNNNNKRMKSTTIEKPREKVAIIVPFRDLHVEQKRKAHLNEFVPYMHTYLSEDASISDFAIYIIEQSNDGKKFNRGKLLNIGYLLAKQDGFTSFIFHDVDLIPHPIIRKWYAMSPTHPIHIARCWDRYNDNPKYLGGILSFNGNDFEAIDGYPNIYWGWGGEDDEVQKRVDFAGFKIIGPEKNIPNAIRDLEEMSLQDKLQFLKQNRDWKCNVKWEVNDEHEKYRKDETKPTWWGLKNIHYKTLKRNENKKCITVLVDLLYDPIVDGKWVV